MADHIGKLNTTDIFHRAH